VKGRPGLVTSYRADAAVFRSTTQRVSFAVAVAAALIGVAWLPKHWIILLGTAFFAAIAAIGLNLLTGYAGQVSLAHAFFLGVGAYTGAALAGEKGKEVFGLGLDLVLALPAAGLVAAAVGALVSPLAVRLRGLYLAFVTLGLVFVGEHVFRNWDQLSGGAGVGRRTALLSLFGFRFDQDGAVLGVDFTKQQKIYLLGLFLLIGMALLAKNLVRSKWGRAFAAVRDRDLAAEVMGIDLAATKALAFSFSAFYAGVAGALLYAMSGVLEPSGFNLLLSVSYIAMILIGGAGSIAGSIVGAFFITTLPELIELAVRHLPLLERFVTTASAGGFLTASQLERILFGLLIIGFLILEPLGLMGIWLRVRNYFKAWPFSY